VRYCYIRATHPYGYRSGQWAKITGVEWSLAYQRPVYAVTFVDGITDYWPVTDGNDPYEFSAEPRA
jgi:hypothetical protein